MKKEVILRGEAVEVDKITMTERPFAPEKAEAARPEKGKPQKDSKYKD